MGGSFEFYLSLGTRSANDIRFILHHVCALDAIDGFFESHDPASLVKNAGEVWSDTSESATDTYAGRGGWVSWMLPHGNIVMGSCHVPYFPGEGNILVVEFSLDDLGAAYGSPWDFSDPYNVTPPAWHPELEQAARALVLGWHAAFGIQLGIVGPDVQDRNQWEFLESASMIDLQADREFALFFGSKVDQQWFPSTGGLFDRAVLRVPSREPALTEPPTWQSWRQRAFYGVMSALVLVLGMWGVYWLATWGHKNVLGDFGGESGRWLAFGIGAIVPLGVAVALAVSAITGRDIDWEALKTQD